MLRIRVCICDSGASMGAQLQTLLHALEGAPHALALICAGEVSTLSYNFASHFGDCCLCKICTFTGSSHGGRCICQPGSLCSGLREPQCLFSNIERRASSPSLGSGSSLGRAPHLGGSAFKGRTTGTCFCRRHSHILDRNISLNHCLRSPSGHLARL